MIPSHLSTVHNSLRTRPNNNKRATAVHNTEVRLKQSQHDAPEPGGIAQHAAQLADDPTEAMQQSNAKEGSITQR